MLSYQYTLHWWAFDPPNPLVCVSCAHSGSCAYSTTSCPSSHRVYFSQKTHTQQLFAGHSIKQELHLLVCESVEEERVTVVGHQ